MNLPHSKLGLAHLITPSGGEPAGRWIDVGALSVGEFHQIADILKFDQSDQSFFSSGIRAYGRPIWKRRGLLFAFSVKSITYKRKPKETKMEEKNGIFFVPFPELPQCSFYSFFSQDEEKRKNRSGGTVQTKASFCQRGHRDG